jgi:hypothetical protein
MEQTGTPNSQLFEAYTKAYAKVQHVTKNAHNPHFKSNYADLGAVIDTIKPVFEEFGLAVYQAPGKLVQVGDTVAVSVVSILMHTSGQALPIETQVPVGQKATAQAAGGAITYARRYALAAIAGIAQVDDDGNEASGRGTREVKSPVVALANLADQLEACTAIGTEGGNNGPTDIEYYREAVIELGDAALVKHFQAKRKTLKGGKK